MSTVEVGDVFDIPLGEGAGTGVGQVVNHHGGPAFYMIVFDYVCPEGSPVNIEAALNSSILFLALTLDAKINAGHWHVIARSSPVRDDIPYPAYIAGKGDAGFFIVDYTDTRSRPVEPSDAGRFSFQVSVGPVRLENALKAHLGLIPWNPFYDEVVPRWITSREVFG
jgi:hypothetical protein